VAVEAVEAEVVGRAGEDLEGCSVGLVGVDGPGEGGKVLAVTFWGAKRYDCGGLTKRSGIPC
jgi:hypothetical protein